MVERRITKKYILVYSAFFIGLSILVFFPFLKSGKSMIGNGDGQSQYILQLEYMGRYLRNWVSGCFHGNFMPERYDFLIGMGDDISTIVRFHPLDFLSVFVPSAGTEILYHVLIFLRLYLAGLAFSIYAFSWKNDFGKNYAARRYTGWNVLLGSIVYLFCGYTFCLGIVHPTYLSPLISLPLLFLGAERMIQEPQKHCFCLFTVVTALSFFSNYYFMFISSIALLFYVLFRFFQLQTGCKETVKAFFSLFIRMSSAYLVGVMIAAVTLYPTLKRYASSYRSARITELNNLLIYEDKRRYIAWLINLISPLRASGNGTHLNYAVIVLPALVYLFLIHKREDESDERRLERSFLRFCAVSLLLCLLVPACGYILAVLNNENNRWVFLIALFLGGTVSFALEDFIVGNKRAIRGLWLITLLYDLLVLTECLIAKVDLYNILAAVELTIFTILLGVLIGKKTAYIHIFFVFAVVVSTLLNGWMTFGEPFGNLTKYYMDRGTSLSTYRKSCYSDYCQIREDEWYRVDGMFARNNEDNAALYLRYPGVQMYNSVLNPYEIDALMKTGNVGLTTMLHVHNLDGRTVTSALAGVRYFMADWKNRGSVPYGYKKEPVFLNGKRAIYENRCHIGLSFGLARVMRLSEYLLLNPVEREYVMMEAAIVEDSCFEEYMPELTAEEFKKNSLITSEQLSFPEQTAGIRRMETGYQIIDTKDSLILSVHRKKGTECFLWFAGLKTEKSGKIRIVSDGIRKNVTILDDSSTYTLGRSDYVVRLGYDSEDTIEDVSLSFTEKGIIGLSGLHIVYVPVENYEEQIRLLNDTPLKNMSIRHDSVTGEIVRDKPGMQVFSIPYSDGWKIEIDGDRRELLLTDLCYMGVFLEEGRHQITLSYQSPGLATGFAMTIVGLLIMIAALVFRRRKHYNNYGLL